LAALDLLGHGRITALFEAVRQQPDDHPFSVLVELDGRVRTLDAGPLAVARAAEVLDRVAPADQRLRWWLSAIDGDRKLLEGDLVGVAAMASIERELPRGPLGDTLTRYVRGRLRRTLGCALIAGIPIDGHEPADDHRSFRSAAIADFRDCGFLPEVATTRALWSSLEALLRWEDPEIRLARVTDAAADLIGVCDPRWASTIDFLVGLVGLMVEDVGATGAAALRLEAAHPRGSVFAPVPAVLRSMTALVERRPPGPGPATAASPSSLDEDRLIAALRDDIDALRGAFPRLVPTLQMQIAHLLGDRGHPAAVDFGAAALDNPVSGAVDEIESILLEFRVEAARGTVRPLDQVMARLEQLVQLGQRQSAAVKALRLAQDYRRIGAEGPAQRLGDWGMAQSDTPREREFWAQRWPPGHAAPAPGGATDPSRPASPAPPRRTPTTTLRVLCPTIELRRGPQPVTLRPLTAKLLLALVLHAPSPLHVEQASDLLWPGLELSATRLRLRSVVHRLRRALDPERSTLNRHGDVLALEPGSLDVDLFHLRAATADDAAAAAGAVVALRGNLCQAEFPYDDLFVEGRAVVENLWRRLATRLLEQGDVDVDDLAPAAAALGLSAAELSP
jgi:hypothetical protein